LYRLARAGKITQMTGLDSAYEPPLNPELIAQTDQPLLEPTVQRLMDLLQPHTD
jgi:adenylylsulfate kinase-like enzyme